MLAQNLERMKTNKGNIDFVKQSRSNRHLVIIKTKVASRDSNLGAHPKTNARSPDRKGEKGIMCALREP